MNSIQKTLQLGWNLLKIGLRRPARLSHVFGTALGVSEEVVDGSADLLRFRQATLNDLLPNTGTELRLTLALFPQSVSSISALEMISLILLMKKARAANVFEFGTYKGVSATQLALNLPAHGRLYTLDLPEGQTQVQFPHVAEDKVIAFENGKGALVPADVKGRVHFLYQDSAQFDESPYAGQMDFIFVDGSHSAEYVRNDTEKALRMLRRDGIIAWHDCGVMYLEVTRYLLQCPLAVTRLQGTTLAFALKP